ncbi:MAG: ATP phosphoribosyltransferase regulatory subunit [DPANN group archaeon]|nr:ATP phosphoribosyltransferase regulatory subunit [DPANN group archaeon]
MPEQNIDISKNVYPADIIKIKWIYKNIRDTLNSIGFKEVEPTSKNSKDLTEILQKEGVEDLCLINYENNKKDSFVYDTSTNIIEMSKEVRLPKPMRWYAISKIYRKEQNKLKNKRSCSACIMGSKDVFADSEQIYAILNILTPLGIEPVVHIGHRELMSEILKYMGIEENVIDQALTIFKDSKIDGIQATFKKFNLLGVEKIIVTEILNLLKFEGLSKDLINHLKNTFNDNDEISILIEELNLFIDELDNYNILRFCKLDLKIIGTTYNDGIVFEVYDIKNNKFQIASGGRVNMLAELLSNNEMPSTALNIDVDMIYNLIEKKKIVTKIEQTIDIYVAPESLNSRRNAIMIAKQFRKKKGIVEIDISGRSLDKQILHAKKLKIPKIIIIRDDDLKNGFVIMEDFKTKENTKIILKGKTIK